MYWFTSDEHMGHSNILGYCNRPFKHVDEMDDTIIRNHNEVVGPDDTVFHLGDFTLKGKSTAENYIRRLNGKHVFLQGSHDYWMKDGKVMIEQKIGDVYVIMCHYPMRSWPRSFHGSIQLYGHVHGKESGSGKQMDVGVDTVNFNHRPFYPYSMDEIKNLLVLEQGGVDKGKEPC